MRKLLVLTILALLPLGGCALAPPTTGGVGSADLTRLQAEQASLAHRLDQMQDRLLFIEARLQDQQRQLSQPQGPGVAEKVTQPGQITGLAPVTPPAAPLVEGKLDQRNSPTEVYLQAFSDYAAGRFEPAIAGFGTFLANFPNNDHAANAQYWLGECYYSLEQYDRALAAFQKVVSDYPRGSKAPDALLKIASVQMKTNQKEAAEQTLRQLRGTYPGSAAARKSLQAE